MSRNVDACGQFSPPLCRCRLVSHSGARLANVCLYQLSCVWFWTCYRASTSKCWDYRYVPRLTLVVCSLLFGARVALRALCMFDIQSYTLPSVLRARMTGVVCATTPSLFCTFSFWLSFYSKRHRSWVMSQREISIFSVEWDLLVTVCRWGSEKHQLLKLKLQTNELILEGEGEVGNEEAWEGRRLESPAGTSPLLKCTLKSFQGETWSIITSEKRKIKIVLLQIKLRRQTAEA